jgi:phosphatidylglycerophosphate synthase
MVNKLEDNYECPIDIIIFKFIDKHLHIFHKLGLTPNMVTTLSIVFGLLSAFQILQNRLWLAAIFWLIAYYLDCVDGKLARKYNMVSKFGDLYDHIGDLLKFIAVLSALIYSNKKGTSRRQWIYLTIMLLLGILQVIHMGYQESIYNKKDESPYLNVIRALFVNEEKAKKIIQYTKHFGCGTWFICFAILILFWR